MPFGLDSATAHQSSAGICTLRGSPELGMHLELFQILVRHWASSVAASGNLLGFGFGGIGGQLVGGIVRNEL